MFLDEKFLLLTFIISSSVIEGCEVHVIRLRTPLLGSAHGISNNMRHRLESLGKDM